MAHDRLTEEYLEAVALRIRWRRARGPLLRELNDHIVDQAESLTRSGLPPEEARTRAVAEMGDPAAVGAELDRLHRPRTRWGFGLVVLLVLAAGAWALVAIGWDTDQVFRQLLALCAGALLCGALWFSDYTFIVRRLWWVAGSLVLCGFLLPVLYRMGNRADIAYFSAYTGWSKLTYLFLLLPVLYAALLCRLRGRGRPTVLLLGLLLWVALLPTLSFSTISMAALLLAVCLLTLGVAVLMGWFGPKRPTALLCAWGPAALTLCTLLVRHWDSYVLRRALPVLRPQLDPLGMGFFTLHIQATLTQLPFINLSGTPTTQLFFRPAENQQLLLLDLANRYGWIVYLLAALLTVGFAVYAAVRLGTLKSRSGRLMGMPCAAILTLQCVSYLSINTGTAILHLTDAFPLLTYGPGMLLVDLMLIGVFLSVLRMDALVRDPGTAGPLAICLPNSVDIPLPFGGGSLHIERRRT